MNAIRETGRPPVQRNTFYEAIKVLTETLQTATTEAEPPLDKSMSL